jgi:hypothetical protein
MENLTNRLGFWSATLTTLLVLLIDAGMILSTIFFPMTTITDIETYAAAFTSWQMLPLVPSFILAPTFAVMMLCIYHAASPQKKILGQLSFSFAIVCAAILSTHYYIQLTVVQQGLLTNQTSGLWLFASPNPNSLFWSFAALGYGFMGISALFAIPIFKEKHENKASLLLTANGIAGIAFLIGNVLGIFFVNILMSFIWGTLFPIATILVAKTFRKNQNA